MRLILLGAPGAGKGTQADVVKSKYNIAHISTGDILRANVKQGTELGKLAQGYMTSGKLVPDDVIINMMKARLVEPDCKEGFMLDGFPRTITQAEALDKMLAELGIALDAVVSLEIDDEVVVSRLTSRRVCKQCGEIYNTIGKPSRVDGVCDKCGGEVIQRADDNEGTIRNRLSVFHEQTAPLIEYYKKAGILVSVDATAGKDSVLKIIERQG
ncbi:MAG: adenylate kinase [Synergistaceae bacterium]|nr:adenylate kinase [Synergistaceae bacterium]